MYRDSSQDGTEIKYSEGNRADAGYCSDQGGDTLNSVLIFIDHCYLRIHRKNLNITVFYTPAVKA
jgi:hypothetical protein